MNLCAMTNIAVYSNVDCLSSGKTNKMLVEKFTLPSQLLFQQGEQRLHRNRGSNNHAKKHNSISNSQTNGRCNRCTNRSNNPNTHNRQQHHGGSHG
ncbi:hypothetical protein PHMEG_00020408 [Phytophthora megakarya]|uniref:Uncharacterized protein n=1 Tax=Phytophthora megakarya TaxID=4795 RepID=A0A225VNZ9_9STRA|nr:hypothetical protein PHMEG_00020408 [Phytophthora megakarya]